MKCIPPEANKKCFGYVWWWILWEKVSLSIFDVWLTEIISLSNAQSQLSTSYFEFIHIYANINTNVLDKKNSSSMTGHKMNLYGSEAKVIWTSDVYNLWLHENLCSINYISETSKSKVQNQIPFFNENWW